MGDDVGGGFADGHVHLFVLVAAGGDDVPGLEVAGTHFHAHARALQLPVVEFKARRFLFAVVHLHAHALRLQVTGKLVGGLQHGLALFAPADGNDHHLHGRELGRQHQAPVIAVHHQQRANQARADAPRGGVNVLQLSFLVLEGHVKRLGKVLAQVVAGAGLDRAEVLRHRLDGVGVVGTGELLTVALDSRNHRHRHPVLGKGAIDIEDGQAFLLGFLVGGVGGVPFLPQKLGGTQKQAGAQFPAHHVRPLVDQQGEIAVALNPVLIAIPDDRFAGRPDDELFFQPGVGVYDHPVFRILQAVVRHHGALLGKAIHVLGFAAKE